MCCKSRYSWLYIVPVLAVIIIIGVYYCESFNQQASRNVSPLVRSDIVVTQPAAKQVIVSPYVIKGKAKGNWFFEASFPIRLEDNQGNLITTTIARAQSDWMTTNYVPFEAVLSFPQNLTGNGKLIFSKDNPSGLPQNAGTFQLMIRFN